MPKRVCRLRLRPGLPVSLSIYPSTTFLDLPREVRDKIYHESLIALNPITVWSCSRECTEPVAKSGGKRTATIAYTVEPRDEAIASLTINLLWCHPIVAREAAQTFYHYNTFHVTGWDVWSPMYYWLNDIGDANRSYLRKLSMDLSNISLDVAWVDQCRIRTRQNHGFNSLIRKVDSILSPSDPSWMQLDFFPLCMLPRSLDPAIEACFRILGQDGPALLLKLGLGFKAPPGSELPSRHNDSCIDMEDFAYSTISMTVPNEVERVRHEFASRVDVLWEGEVYTKEFEEQREVLAKQGWDVVEEKEVLWPRERESYVDYFTNQTMWYPQSASTCFAVRRRHLVV